MYRVPSICTAECEEQKAFFYAEAMRVWPIAELGARAKLTREYVVKQFWLSFREDKSDLENAIQTKAELSCAIAVMDKIGGWEEEEGEQENWVGPRFASSIWIYTKSVVCNGQNHKQNNRIFQLRSILEAVNWVCVTCGADLLVASKRSGSPALRP